MSPGLKLSRSGKVRDIYDLGDKLLMVATDRISAFDYVLPTPIPGKGELLTRMSAFWFKNTASLVPNHLISADIEEIRKSLPSGSRLDPFFNGRTMLVWKAKRIDAECIVRGYLAGSGWKEYKRSGTCHSAGLPAGLEEAQKLPEPIFTPSSKNDEGHDENISREELKKSVGARTAGELERLSLELYNYAAKRLIERGIILADTKFEFGFLNDRIIIIDEMVTPDSSRFWDASAYRKGVSPENFDKQYVRDYLQSSGWDRNSQPPCLPDDVVEGTLRRYKEAFEKVTGDNDN